MSVAVMADTAQAICRACGSETTVTIGEGYVQGFLFPSECGSCESDDLVLLRNLTREEIEEIERGRSL